MVKTKPKRTKLTDKDKKNIIADYVECQNYSEVARKYKISDTAVKKIVLADKDSLNKFEEKKEENTKDILKYMDSIYDKQKKVIDLSLEALEKKLTNPDMFTNVKDIATVYGVIFDKALKYKEIQIKNEEIDNSSINDSITNIAELINNPVENRSEDSIDE